MHHFRTLHPRGLGKRRTRSKEKRGPWRQGRTGVEGEWDQEILPSPGVCFPHTVSQLWASLVCASDLLLLLEPQSEGRGHYRLSCAKGLDSCPAGFLPCCGYPFLSSLLGSACIATREGQRPSGEVRSANHQAFRALHLRSAQEDCASCFEICTVTPG